MTGTIGEYVVVILDENGALPEVECTTKAQVPLVGHEITIDDDLYLVERVRHDAEPGAPIRRKRTVPTVFVRRVEDGARKKPPVDQPSTNVPPARVIPLALHRGHFGPVGRWAILPGWLVAMIVHSGYLDQRVEFRHRRRVAARLIREGARWYLDRGAQPKDLWALSRRAKLHFEELDLILREVGDGILPMATCEFQPPHALSPPPPRPSPPRSPELETPSLAVVLPLKRPG